MTTWPDDMPVNRVRFARQTNRLAALKQFYCEGLSLQVLSEFHGHDGYDGLILGLPDRSYQLEFVQHEDGSGGTAPNPENLLVFYIPSVDSVQRVSEKLVGMGYARVRAENSYWEQHNAITIEDPDRWRVVLQPVDE